MAPYYLFFCCGCQGDMSSHYDSTLNLPFACLSISCFCLNRNTCVHWTGLCRGACCDNHVSGDGKDHHQADVRLPEELHLWRRLWLCTGGIRLGPPRPQSWAGTQVRHPSLSGHISSDGTLGHMLTKCFISWCSFLSDTDRPHRIKLNHSEELNIWLRACDVMNENFFVTLCVKSCDVMSDFLCVTLCVKSCDVMSEKSCDIMRWLWHYKLDDQRIMSQFSSLWHYALLWHYWLEQGLLKGTGRRKRCSLMLSDAYFAAC